MTDHFSNPPTKSFPNASTTTPTTPAPNAPPGPTRHLGDVRTPILLVVCAIGFGGVVVTGGSGNDGASAVPLVALIGIAGALLRRHPDVETEQLRPVGANVAGLVMAASFGLLVVSTVRPGMVETLVGPAISAALLGTYLGLWGVRSMALFRTVSLLSLLTWTAVAERVHAVVRTTLAQPSEMIYTRLANLSWLGIEQEPWRLHTANLHHGALVVISTVIFAVAVVHRRIDGRMLVETLTMASVALVIHHLIVLASPLDQYTPDEVTSVAKNPVLEIGIGAMGILVVTAIRQFAQRGEHATSSPQEPGGRVLAQPGRDPFIFDTAQASASAFVTTMLFSGAAAFGVVMLVAF